MLLSKLGKNQRKMKYFVFDVETWGLDATPDNFALGVIYGDGYVFRTNSREKMIQEIFSKKHKYSVFFAHNALYDLSTLFGNIITELDNKAVFNNSTFICARRDGITFADSMNIYNARLSKIGEILGMSKGETPDKFKEGIPCELEPSDYDYCELDCKIVYTALKKLFDEVGKVKITLAGLAMYYFRTNYMKKDIHFNSHVYEFFQSYYGGRTEAFKLGTVSAEKFDINSMYPFAMRECQFPDPDKLKKREGGTIEEFLFYLRNYEGMAHVEIEHEKTYFGYLPIRHDGKVIFPVGIFEGAFNFNELRFAVDSGKVKIRKVYFYIYAPPQESIFKDFVNDLYAKRLNAKSELEKYIYKIILNSLYGKFAQKLKASTRYVPKLTENEVAELFKQDANFEIKAFSESREDAFIITKEEEFSPNTIPVFSSYITSYARIYLLKQLLQYQKCEIVYCDTDSIALENYIIDIPTGPELGKFKAEGKRIIFIYGNKSYIEIDGGRINRVVKGVTKDSLNIAENVFTSKRMIKPKTALRRGLEVGKFVEETKTIQGWETYDKRQIIGDGLTLPLELGTNKLIP